MNSLDYLAGQFDEDYFEDGIRKHKSLYENFRWMPWISLPIANAIKKLYPNKSILDWGCGKGFIVHALRLLNVEAYGFDISEYALSHCKMDVAEFLFAEKSSIPDIDVIFIKDSLEHLPYEAIDNELSWMAQKCERACFIVPFGEDGRYRIREYGFDVTHIIKEDEEWWIKKFIKAGFIIEEFSYQMESIKENWYQHHPYGNGIFLLRKEL